MKALQVSSVRFAYGDRTCLVDVDLDVDAGEIVCLLGPSGCGKTTLLRLVAGLEQVGAGSIRVGDTVLSGPSRHVAAESRPVGLVFQDYALFPHLDVRANIEFGLSRWPKEERRKRAEELLGLTGLRDYAERFPHTLSGGEQQRVALARALAPGPDILLLDEPFSGLDANARSSVRAETRELLRSSGTAALLVTHDAEEAMQVADRIAILAAGRLLQVGTPEDVYLNPADPFVAAFFGEVNRFDAVVSDEVGHTPVGPVAAEGWETGARITVIVRPEAVCLKPRTDRGGAATVQAGKGRLLRVVESRLMRGRRLTWLETADADSAADGPRRLAMRHDVSELVSAGDQVEVSLDPSLVHIFPSQEESGDGPRG